MKKLKLSAKLEIEYGDEVIFPFKDEKTLMKFNTFVRNILFMEHSKHHDLSTRPPQLMIKDPVWRQLPGKDQEAIEDHYHSLI